MASVADLFASLFLDDSQFQAQIVRSADKGALTAGQRISKGLGKALTTGLGALAGAGFGMMVQGATELDAATQKLTADTGLTGQAAKDAEGAIAGMYQHNLQGFDQIGAAMAVVINGLDLTGAAADAMTEKFLEFATATGQEAAPAVSSFHELLNAWSLTAEAAPGIMDQLIASHQKYGSSVAENEDALRKLAPQMSALGMNIDDTIGLLNLFDVAGMDSSKAMFALNTAVKNLKPGQTLNDLIKQVSSIEDPTVRAQMAIKLFGARGGVNLANALKPGITSLEQFKTSQEENANATTKAADAVKSGFGAQFQLILHNAGGALAELGTQFGPLIIAASMVGPKIGAALGGLGTLILPKIIGMFKSTTPAVVAAAAAQGTAAGAATAAAQLSTEIAAEVPGQVAQAVIPEAIAAGAKVGTSAGAAAATAEVSAETAGVAAGQTAVAAGAAPAAAAAGTTIGGVMGRAAALAIPALIVAGVAMAAEAIKPELDKLALQTHDAIFGSKGPFDDIGKAFSDLPWPFGPKGTPDISVGPFEHILGGDSAIKKAEDHATTAGRSVVTHVEDALTAGAPGVTAAAETMVAGVPEAFANLTDEVGKSGAEVAQDYADSLDKGRANVDKSFDGFVSDLKDALSPTAEMALRFGQLTSKQLADGLKSGDAHVRAQAEATRQAIIDRLTELDPTAGNIAKGAAGDVAGGITAGLPGVKAAAGGMWNAISKPGTVDFYAQGAQVPQEIADGIRSKRDAIDQAMQELKDGLEHPMDLTTEVARITGMLVGDELAKGLRSHDPAVSAQAQATKDLLIARLKEIQPSALVVGKQVGDLLAAGMRSKDPDVRKAAQDAKTIISEELARTKQPAGDAGKTAATNLVNNILATIGAAIPGMRKALTELLSGGGKGITVTVSAPYAGPGGHAPPRAAGGPVTADMPYVVGEKGPEWFVPQTSGRIVPNAAGSTTYNIPVSVTGLIKARTPEDIARPLRQLAQVGYFNREPRLSGAGS
jgi:hypothetical protein